MSTQPRILPQVEALISRIEMVWDIPFVSDAETSTLVCDLRICIEKIRRHADASQAAVLVSFMPPLFDAIRLAGFGQDDRVFLAEVAADEAMAALRLHFRGA